MYTSASNLPVDIAHFHQADSYKSVISSLDISTSKVKTWHYFSFNLYRDKMLKLRKTFILNVVDLHDPFEYEWIYSYLVYTARLGLKVQLSLSCNSRSRRKSSNQSIPRSRYRGSPWTIRSLWLLGQATCGLRSQLNSCSANPRMYRLGKPLKNLRKSFLRNDSLFESVVKTIHQKISGINFLRCRSFFCFF